MMSNRPATSTRIRTAVPALVIVVGLAACSSGSNATSTPKTAANSGATNPTTGLTTGSNQKQWKGDPCSLLTTADIAGLSTTWDLASSAPAPSTPASKTSSCEFSLQGSGTNSGTQVTVNVFIDARSDFDVNQGVFKGTKLAGIGTAAWRGDHGGQASDTIGVQLANLSFRVDSASALASKGDLVILAKAVAAHLG